MARHNAMTCRRETSSLSDYTEIVYCALQDATGHGVSTFGRAAANDTAAPIAVPTWRHHDKIGIFVICRRNLMKEVQDNPI